MGGEIGGMIASAGLVVLIGGLIVLSWPFRRERELRFRRRIAAPRERVWDTYANNPDDPRSAALHKGLISARRVSDDPVVHEYILDASCGHGTHLVPIRSETRIERRPELSEQHTCEIDGKPDPFGAQSVERLELQEHSGGTIAALTWRGETRTLWQFLHMRFFLAGYIGRLQKICESEKVAPTAAPRRSLWWSLSLSLLAVASFALWVGWAFALIISVVAILHEYGHWLAMRLTGQPAPRMMLVPFFGGIAVANHPHKTQFDDTFCSLMGAGLSALVCIGLLVPAFVLEWPPLSDDLVPQFAGFMIGRSVRRLHDRPVGPRLWLGGLQASLFRRTDHRHGLALPRGPGGNHQHPAASADPAPGRRPYPALDGSVLQPTLGTAGPARRRRIGGHRLGL
jgi:hypothetical protein